MRIFGLTIERQKAAVAPISHADVGWRSIIRESFPGAWQRNMDFRPQNVLTHSALYACVTLIASDIGKLRIKLVEQDADGIWTETTSAAFSPVLRKPNHYQNRIKFIEQWILSKIIHGNAYILKERDTRGVVIALYVLDPCRVTVLVAPDSSVYYQLGADNLAGITSVTVPASEIIHDIGAALYHPLCGVSPITACALPAVHGLSIQDQSAKFFANGSAPGGILTAPGFINTETADRMKRDWNEKFGGNNVGKVAILGDGLNYTSMSVNATDAQLIEQLKWTAEQICTTLHVPAYMVGVGPPPNYNNINALNSQYYSQCIQTLIECLELCLDEGLGLTNVKDKVYGTELDLDGLLRMDTAGQVKAAIDGIGGGLFAPDEARKKFDLRKQPGGSNVYLQQQMWSLEQLSKRKGPTDMPPAPGSTPPAALPPPDATPPGKSQDEIARIMKAAAESLERKLAA